MVPITHRVTDISQLKFHAQENGICVSLKEGEWVWLAREVAFYLGSMLELSSPPLISVDGEDISEDEYEVIYQMTDSLEPQKFSVQAISETDALAKFYENVPQEYQAILGRVDIQRKI